MSWHDYLEDGARFTAKAEIRTPFNTIPPGAAMTWVRELRAFATIRRPQLWARAEFVRPADIRKTITIAVAPTPPPVRRDDQGNGLLF